MSPLVFEASGPKSSDDLQLGLGFSIIVKLFDSEMGAEVHIIFLPRV